MSDYQENPSKVYPGISWAIKRWEDQKIIIPELQRKVYEKIATTYQNKSMVDIGSSFGVGANILSHRAMNVWGLELEQELVDFGNALFKKPRLMFQQYDILNPPNRPIATFDVVVMQEVIEHIPRDQWAQAINGIKRFFGPKSVGYITTPNRNAPSIGDDHPGNEFHCYEPPVQEFYDFLIKHFNAVTLFSIPKLNTFAVEETVDLNTKETPLLARVERGTK